MNEDIARQARQNYAQHKIAADAYDQATSDVEYFSGEVRRKTREANQVLPSEASLKREQAIRIGEKIVPALMAQETATGSLEQNLKYAAYDVKIWKDNYIEDAIDEALIDGYQPNLPAGQPIDEATNVRKIDQ